MSRFRRSAFLLMALSLGAVAVPPEIGGLMPPQSEEPRVIAEKDIPEEEKVSTLRLPKRPPGVREIILEAHLDDRLANRIDELDRQTGQADGKLALGDYVVFPIHVFSTVVIDGSRHDGDAEHLHPVRKPDTDPPATGEQGSHRAFRLKCHTVFGISPIGFGLAPWSDTAELITITAL